MSPHSFEDRVQDFFKAISASRSAYTYVRFNFLAIRDTDTGEFVVRRGRVFLNTGQPSTPDRQFETQNIKAGSFRTETLGITPEELVTRLFKGSINTPIGILSIEARQASVNPFFVENQHKFCVMSVYGSDSISLERTAALEWEVRAAILPYDGLQELASDLGVGAFQPQSGGGIEVIAFNVMAMDGSSRVDGDTARIAVRLAHGLNTDLATVGYRELMNGNVVGRKTLSTAEFEWDRTGEFMIGTAEAKVTPAVALQCFCSYAGSVQHTYWIADPSTAQNAKRAAYELIDPSLEMIKENFQRETFRGKDARELESNISWLLWMLGFSVAHLGATPRTQDAIDIIATTPAGNFAVIECTTGLLKADNKLPRLVERTEAIRRRLEASGNRHLRVIPVIVTTKSRDEIGVELEQAERQKILVVARDDLERACDNTVIHQDADVLFDRAENAIRDSFAKHAVQPQLPLPLTGASVPS